MITLHCSCGETIRTGLGPSSVTCKCGKVHGLPSLGPSSPERAAAGGESKGGAPASAAPLAAAPAPPKDDSGEIRANPFGARHRVAIHDGMAAPKRVAVFQNPVVAGGVSVGVLGIALVVAIVLRNNAERKRAEAEAPENGRPCSFQGAGVEFLEPPGWKLVQSSGNIFAFETPKGTVSVSVLPIGADTHAERVRNFQPTADWAAGASELPDAELLVASWKTDRNREADSWWMDRGNHRLWISAEGKPGVRADAAVLIKTMKLSAPVPVTDGH